MTKLFMFISVLVFFAIPGQALAGKITFKIENEKGLPQPIEVRQQLDDGELDFLENGFSQVTLGWANPGDVFFISRQYQGVGSDAPEGKGFRYVYSSSSPLEVTFTAPLIKSRFSPQPVSDLSRGILGEINRRREVAGVPKAPSHPYLNEAASVWTQELEMGAQKVNSFNEQFIWNYHFGVRIQAIMGIWLPDLDYYMNRKTCENFSGETIKCTDLFLSPSIEYIGVSDFGVGAYIFSAVDCRFNCDMSPDFGDPALLDSPICSECGGSTLKDPNFRTKFFKKTKKLIVARASCKSDASGSAKLIISNKKRKLRVTGFRTQDGFAFRVRLKKPLVGKIKAIARFSGDAGWQSGRVRFL